MNGPSELFVHENRNHSIEASLEAYMSRRTAGDRNTDPASLSAVDLERRRRLGGMVNFQDVGSSSPIPVSID